MKQWVKKVAGQFPELEVDECTETFQQILKLGKNNKPRRDDFNI